jgi:cyclic pyranopterin phosphate synthase
MDKLSHYDDAGQAHMVDVSAKSATKREAVAAAFVELSEAVLAALPQNPKGNPLEVARFAGITAATTAGTGVEMEAMVAASIAALTVYDMTKALDKGIRIREVVLLRKSGGKSGPYRR